MKNTKASFVLVQIAVMLAFCVVVLGAFTRLKDAGLGCPDWPTCYGHAIWPNTAEQIAAAQQAFPDSPFEQEKAWPEVVHRYFAGTLGFLIVLIAGYAIKLRSQPDQPFRLPLLLLGLVIAQGLFGMWTVTLKLWPQVVTGHLLGGFATLSLLWLLRLRLINGPWNPPNIPLRYWHALKPWAFIGLLLVICQIFLGGWTSTNYAALACPDLPTCQHHWWPPMDFADGFNFGQEIGPNYLGGQLDGEARIAIHMTHRFGAMIVALYLIFLTVKLKRHAGGSDMKRQANVILGLLLVQLSLGISNVLWSLPLPVAVAHNACGALLLLSLISLNYRLHKSTAPW
ncbi:MAG TPA: COX15/CtaA family protein [Candidatus Acidoferrum sp.]|nr:COX15/CtaA family protein [Candidatus Acidoferrum sp.]